MADKPFKGEKSNIHAGHRKRVKQKFIKDGGLQNFTDVELLELLLYYAYPMKDTNEIAHRLLEQHGNLYKLLNHPTENLINNYGLTENTAVLLSMLPHIFRRYLKSELDGEKIKNVTNAEKLMVSYLIGKEYECFIIIGLDAKKRVTDIHEFTDMNIGSVSVNSRIVVEKTLLNRSKFVIIGHNHPGGTLKPSEADIAITRRLISDLQVVGVPVLDHIIVTNDGTYSFSRNNLYNLKYDL